MPRTRSQTAADREEAMTLNISDPETNLTLIDTSRRIVKIARAIHFIAATMEDTDHSKTGFIDAIQQSGSRSVVVARKLRQFHDQRFGKNDGDGTAGTNNDDDEDDEEEDEDTEEQVEERFDEDFRSISIRESAFGPSVRKVHDDDHFGEEEEEKAGKRCSPERGGQDSRREGSQ